MGLFETGSEGWLVRNAGRVRWLVPNARGKEGGGLGRNAGVGGGGVDCSKRYATFNEW